MINSITMINSIRYIHLKKKSLERDKILYPVAPRVWKMKLRI
jgi:hypothetical protein